MADRRFVPNHNYVINLNVNQPNADYFRPILEFLQHSRVSHALSHSPQIYVLYIRQFWDSVVYVDANPPYLHARVNGQDLMVTADQIRQALRLGTVQQEAGPTSYSRELRVGTFRRMGFVGDENRNTFFKNGLIGRWKFLAHVIVVAFCNKKSGFDTLNVETQSQIISLVLNRPYSFSRFIFNEMRNQIGVQGTERFLMFPRFVMMIINSRLPNLPQAGETVEVAVMPNRIFKDSTNYRGRLPPAERPQDVNLFGAIVNANYGAPAGVVIGEGAQAQAAAGLAPPQQAAEGQVQQQQQQQPQAQPEVAAQQLNVMLDEQAVNPSLAQAVIHEALQEHAPVDDAIADVEAYHEAEMPEMEAHDDDAVVAGSEGEEDHSDSDDTDSDTDSDDSANRKRVRAEIVAKMSHDPALMARELHARGLVSDSSSSDEDEEAKRKREDEEKRLAAEERERAKDADYQPSDEELESQSRPRKKSRTDADVGTSEGTSRKGKGVAFAAPVLKPKPSLVVRIPASESGFRAYSSVPSSAAAQASLAVPNIRQESSSRPFGARMGSGQETDQIPSTSKIDALEEKLMIMEALVKSMSDQMAHQQAEHARELEMLSKKNEMLEAQHEKELNEVRQLVAQLAQRFDEYQQESTVRVDAVEKDQSTQLANLLVRVSDLDKFSKTTVTEAKSMAHHVHSVLDNHHQGILRIKDFVDKMDQAVVYLASRINVQATCRDDPLSNVRREDRDDDPDMSRQGEMTGFPTNLAHQASTSKGESSQGIGQSEASQGQVDEDIDAFDEYQDDFIQVDNLKDFDELSEDEEEVEDLEEGEFIPEADWNPFVPEKDFVFEFETDQAVFEAEAVHVILEQAVPGLRFAVVARLEGKRFVQFRVEGDDILLKDLSKAEEDKESQDPRADVSTQKADEASSSAETEKKTHPILGCDISDWFKRKDSPTKYLLNVFVPETSTLKGRIISWLFDEKLSLFIIKRFDGTQYLKPKLRSFNSLPRPDFHSLASLELINRGDLAKTEFFVKWIKNDVWLKRKGETDSSKFKFHPRKGKKIINPDIIDSRTGKPQVTYQYGRVRCVPRIPLKKWSQDILQELDSCWIDNVTSEAVLMAGADLDFKELLRIYDPMQLINISRNDLLKLQHTDMTSTDLLRGELERYQQMVNLCLKEGIHPDSDRIFGKGKEKVSDA